MDRPKTANKGKSNKRLPSAKARRMAAAPSAAMVSIRIDVGCNRVINFPNPKPAAAAARNVVAPISPLTSVETPDSFKKTTITEI